MMLFTSIIIQPCLANKDTLKPPDNIKTVIDSSSLTFKELYSDIKVGITALASSLKIEAEHVYEVLVKQQIVYAITYIIIFTPCIILIILGYKWGKKIGWDEDESLVTLICFIPAVILFMIFLLHIDDITMGLINPEYGAIKDILNIIKK